GAKWHLCSDDAVAAEEVFLAAEHMHRAALASGVSTFAPGEFCHHAFRVHAGYEHVAVIPIAGDDLIPLFNRHLHSDDDRFLPDIEVTKSADQDRKSTRLNSSHVKISYAVF